MVQKREESSKFRNFFNELAFSPLSAQEVGELKRAIDA